MGDITERNATDSQATWDYLRNSLLIFNNTTINKPYINVSGAIEAAGIGQLVGVIAASGKYTICKSAATDGSQIPRGVLTDAIVDLAIAGEITGVTIVNFGKINVNSLVFDGTDDLDTLVGGVRMEDLLIANSKGLELVDVQDDSRYDN